MTSLLRTSFVASCLCVIAAASAQQPTALQFGPLRFGMSDEEVRAATAGVEWHTSVKSQYTNRVFAIAADNSIELAGMRFDATVGHPYHSGAWMRLERAQGVNNAMECEAQALALVTAVESDALKFTGPPPDVVGRSAATSLNWTTQRLPGGAIVVTPSPQFTSGAASEELIKVGAGSTVTVGGADDKMQPLLRKKAAKKDPKIYWVRTHAVSGTAPAEIRVSVFANYERGRSCELELSAIQDHPWSEPPAIKFDATKVIERPTIGMKNRALAAFPPLPAAGMNFDVDCKVNAAYGSVECGPPEVLPDEDAFHALARILVSRYRIDPDTLDRDEPGMLSVTIPIRLDPSDRREIDLAKATPVAGELRIKKRRYRAAEDFYPPAARRANIVGTVDVSCVTQEDGSLICALTPDLPPPPEMLIKPAIALAEQYVYEPVTSGKPIAGFLIKRKIDFKLAE